MNRETKMRKAFALATATSAMYGGSDKAMGMRWLTAKNAEQVSEEE